MNQNEKKVFFVILRSAIDGNKLNNSEIQAYSCDILPGLLKLSAKHDVVRLFAFGLKQNALVNTDNNDDSDIEKYILKSVYRYEELRY